MKTTCSKFRALLFLLFFLTGNLTAQTVLISWGGTWKYWANSEANFPSGWQQVVYNDTGWPSGTGELGYGDSDESTCIPANSPVSGTLCLPTGNKWPSYYFRKTISIPDPSLFSDFTFSIERDDGFVVYVNGIEVGRNNMPAGAVSYTTSASAAVEDAVISFTVSTSYFSAGTNVIAVEMHQASVSGTPALSSSSDISFNLQLEGNDAMSIVMARSPYLQAGSTDGITIRWRTTVAQDSRVEIGTVSGTYPVAVSDATAVTEHIIRVNGLSADTKYFYRVGNSTVMQTPDPDQFFTTLPPANSTRKIRVIAFGDCGRGVAAWQDQNLATYLDYLSTNSIEAADAWLLLGDNAYDYGLDAEYTAKFFDIYGSSMLKNHKLYPAPGNHEYGNNAANKALRNLAYHNSFTVPQYGEAGGVASNKQNYYSFDIGNIHFISLDSYGTESDGTSIETAGSSALKTWLTADLAANTKKWTIAYWHHPPYTKGSHNSDSESDLVNIRQNFIGFLESRGVDMILCGHSHDYERGYLIKNYTGNWASFNTATHALSTSTASYTSSTTCPYIISDGPAPHGTVYVVSGSAGATGSMNTGFGTGPMPFALNDGGVFYFEVEDNRLDGKLIRRDGSIFDQFTILKQVNTTKSYSIANGVSQLLEASWPGTYSWSTGATAKSITVNPPPNSTTNYSVTDSWGCVTDQFSVVTSSILPVKFTAFDVQPVLKTNLLRWTVTNEQGVGYYVVERSADGYEFMELKQVPVKPDINGQTIHYTWSDLQPLAGTSYYRISVTDARGNKSYTDIQRVHRPQGETFNVQPAESAQGVIVLQFQVPVTTQCTLVITSMEGKRVYTAAFTLQTGVQTKEIRMHPGMYSFTVTNSFGEIVKQKMIIQ